MTNDLLSVRNAANEADALLDPTESGRVLEPSPPAREDEWFADDPVGSRTPGAIVPAGLASNLTVSWTTWLAEHPEHREWVESRWLGGERSLPAVPASLAQTRDALHRLATYVIAPARHQATGKFGLRWTLGGFGTPFFDSDRQIRVVGTHLVDQRGDSVRRAPITSLAAAAEFLETTVDPNTAAEHDSPSVGNVNSPLAIDMAAAHFLGNWFGMGFAALESVRADPVSIDASRPQLWPGHFDPAIEIGDEDHRGSYGASPGDPAIAEPYLYVSIWWPERLKLNSSDPVWNAPSFTGAILKLADFPSGDPAEVAAAFFTTTRDRISAT